MSDMPAWDSIDYNLGYFLLWPLFVGFLVGGWIRFRQLERESAAQERNRLQDSMTRDLADGMPPARPAISIEPDPAMDAYNRYLADLNARELRHHLRSAGLDVFDSPSR
ncbi:hypothetical protein [Nocardia sp. NPDC005825]|uniref:hypothetical protein n=1 Tax=unclassified Nocardia TaxID=2637762 RepID=UPI00340DF261